MCSRLRSTPGSAHASRRVSRTSCSRRCGTNSAGTSSPRLRADMTPPAKPAGPCALIIFGAAGDLAGRLLVPALRNLRREKLLPEEFAVIGLARSKQDDATFRRDLGTSLRELAEGEIVDSDWDWLAGRMSYLQGDFDD